MSIENVAPSFMITPAMELLTPSEHSTQNDHGIHSTINQSIHFLYLVIRYQVINNSAIWIPVYIVEHNHRANQIYSTIKRNHRANQILVYSSIQHNYRANQI